MSRCLAYRDFTIVELTFVQFLGCKYKPILSSEVVITYISTPLSLIVKLGRNSINKLITFSCSGLHFVQLDYPQHRITYKNKLSGLCFPYIFGNQSKRQWYYIRDHDSIPHNLKKILNSREVRWSRVLPIYLFIDQILTWHSQW